MRCEECLELRGGQGGKCQEFGNPKESMESWWRGLGFEELKCDNTLPLCNHERPLLLALFKGDSQETSAAGLKSDFLICKTVVSASCSDGSPVERCKTAWHMVGEAYSCSPW